QRFAALQAGQLQQLGHQTAEPVRLMPNAHREASSGLRIRSGLVLDRVGKRLGEKLERADRRLELVTDVRNEVAAYPVDPVRLGHVERLDRDVAIVKRDGADVNAERLDVTAAWHVEFDLATSTRPPGLPGQRTD